MPTLHGYDISVYQTMNWPAVPALPLAAVQVGWTNTPKDSQGHGPRDRNEMVYDAKYQSHLAGARSKRPRWLFHYLVPVNQPWQTQLNSWLATIGGLPPGEGIFFDLEYVGAIALGAANCMAMMAECERRIGRPVLHYGEVWMPSSVAVNRPLWCASYQNDQSVMEKRYPYPGRAVWQYTGSGSLPGCSGAIDLNQVLDPALLDKATGRSAMGPVLNSHAKNDLISTWDMKGGSKRRFITPRVIVCHTNASGSAVSVASMRKHAEAGAAQPHYQLSCGFHPNEPGDYDMHQLLPTDREGVCSWSGDPFCISIETQDNGATPLDKLNHTPWPPASFENLAQVIAEECKRWGIPAIQATAWNGTGIGWHRQWGLNRRQAAYKGEPPNPPMYVNPWTLTVGKTCPGDARVAQMSQLIARVAQILAVPHPIPAGGNVLFFAIPKTDDPNNKWWGTANPAALAWFCQWESGLVTHIVKAHLDYNNAQPPEKRVPAYDITGKEHYNILAQQAGVTPLP